MVTLYLNPSDMSNEMVYERHESKRGIMLGSMGEQGLTQISSVFLMPPKPTIFSMSGMRGREGGREGMRARERERAIRNVMSGHREDITIIPFIKSPARPLCPNSERSIIATSLRPGFLVVSQEWLMVVIAKVAGFVSCLDALVACCWLGRLSKVFECCSIFFV